MSTLSLCKNWSTAKTNDTISNRNQIWVAMWSTPLHKLSSSISFSSVFRLTHQPQSHHSFSIFYPDLSLKCHRCHRMYWVRTINSFGLNCNNSSHKMSWFSYYSLFKCLACIFRVFCSVLFFVYFFQILWSTSIIICTNFHAQLPHQVYNRASVINVVWILVVLVPNNPLDTHCHTNNKFDYNLY